MNSYITIPLSCPIHTHPDHPLNVSPDELNEAGGYICDHCGQPMRSLRPHYIIEHHTTHELHLLDGETLYRLDGTPLQAPNLVNYWPIHGAVSNLSEWQNQAETLRRYIVAWITNPDPAKTFLTGGHASSLRNWANEHGYTIEHPRAFATPHDARNFAEANNGIAW